MSQFNAEPVIRSAGFIFGTWNNNRFQENEYEIAQDDTVVAFVSFSQFVELESKLMLLTP